MRTMIRGLMIGCLLTASMVVMADKYDGFYVPDTMQSADKTLKLNGVGMRTKFVFDIYVGALYTEKKASTRDEVQALNGPKRIMMQIVYDELPVEKLVEGWNEGFENNSDEDTLSNLRERIEQFNSYFVTLVENDVVLIDIDPEAGTTVYVKGENKGTIEGYDFGRALLDIWLGEEPADEDLKEAMLGDN